MAGSGQAGLSHIVSSLVRLVWVRYGWVESGRVGLSQV
jgi:hypothetical protein